MSKISLTSLKNLLLQVLPIMFGVYLGLVANNWNENRKNKRMEKEILSKMIVEIKSNQAQINNIVDYHKMLLDSSAFFFKNWNTETYSKPAYQSDQSKSIWRGTRTGKLKNTTFDVAIASGAFSNLNIELMTLLSELNRAQQGYDHVASLYLQKVIDLSPEQSVMTYLTFINSFASDIYYMERDLLALYENALERIETELK